MSAVDPETGRVIRSRRPSVLFAIVFILAVGLIVWLMIPRDHASIVINPAPQPTSGEPAQPAPPGSVSGATTATQPEAVTPATPAPAAPQTTQPPSGTTP